MQPILIIMLATAAGLPLGLWLRRNLATLGYRNADEADLPEPGPRWWVVWTSVLAASGLAAAADLSPDPSAYLSLLPPAAAGPWLAAVDFDILRIPNRILGPTAAATTLVVLGLTATTQNWRTIVVPVIAAALVGGAFASVHFATRGGIGFGDVKLAAAIGLATGPLGLGAVWLGTLAGSAAALIWNRATRRNAPIPYGPWLLCGAWVAAIAATPVLA